MSCKEDCGFFCGDGVCDPDVGEDDTTCLADCFFCEPAVNEVINLDAGESALYEIEV